jgi:hypothetical protein
MHGEERNFIKKNVILQREEGSGNIVLKTIIQRARAE